VIGPTFVSRRARSGQVRVGLFGHLGACNIGNDASMEAVLAYLRAAHPQARVDAMCPGPETLRKRYGLPAVPLCWYHRYEPNSSGVKTVGLKILGKGIDTFRTAWWVRRHEVVIVPGAGVLEASLPLWPWGMPYALFLLSAFGRLWGTKVAFVSVGAGVINKRATRWLSNSAARLAFYRSYRDAGARRAMRQRGVDTTRDHVFPDLAFALPAPPYEPCDPRLVAVGVMDYHGSNDERRQAEDIYSAYVSTMKTFVGWLVDGGRRVRLLVGDTNGSDDAVVAEILDELRASRPDLETGQVVAAPVTTFAEVLEALAPVGSVVAIRFHNLVAALKLDKPTISISYSPKHDLLMADMGLSEFCQPVNNLSMDRLVEQFNALECRSAQLRHTLSERNAARARRHQDQFRELSTVLFSARLPASPEALCHGVEERAG
jgi:polysaccharide pyruvyl transferase WcaK-like protein